MFCIFCVLALASSKLQAIGGFYLLSSIWGTFFKIWVKWLVCSLSILAALFLDFVSFLGLLVRDFCLQIIDRDFWDLRIGMISCEIIIVFLTKEVCYGRARNSGYVDWGYASSVDL